MSSSLTDSGAVPAEPGASLPETARCLTEGGDGRITLRRSGRNRYGCQPFPDQNLYSLGSCTASVISDYGFAAADRLRRRLLQGARAQSLARCVAQEAQRQARDLSDLLDLTELGPEIVLADSGTDLHRFAAGLAGRISERTLGCVMVAGEETGSGVPIALAEGSRDVGGGGELLRIALRSADGRPRPAADIDADAERAVLDLLARERHCLLVTTDVSKTGLIAPSPEFVASLHHRFAGRLTVVVDACQMRLSPPTLRAYLQQGFWLILTGSKFLSGPTFSGALLFPGGIDPDAIAALKQPLHPGLLLRWEAALAELRAFRQIPSTRIYRILKTFEQAIGDCLRQRDELLPLPVPTLERPNPDLESWDRVQTIFPFLLSAGHTSGTIRPLSTESTEHVYRSMQTAFPNAGRAFARRRFQIGQPVYCGSLDGTPVSALRLCASSRLVVEASNGNLQAVIDSARAALDKAVWLASDIRSAGS